MQKKNKIDGAIDEVLESQRLKEGLSFIKKIIIFGIVLFIIFILFVGATQIYSTGELNLF